MANRRLILASGRSVSLTAVPEFSFEAAAPDGKAKLPSFTIDAYTGAPMNPGGWYTPVIVDLGGIKAINSTIPILLDHDPAKIIGQADKIDISSNGIRLSGVMTGDDEYAQKVRTHAKNGFRWQASIGASIDREEFLKAGAKATVNGREVTGPLVIARESRLFETSFVAMGADPKTSANVAASNLLVNSQGEIHMNFDAWLKAKGFDPAALNEVQTASMRAAYDAEQRGAVQAQNPQGNQAQTGQVQAGSQSLPAVQAPNPGQVQATNPAQSLDQIVASQRAEQSRVNEITRLTAAAIQERPGLLDTFENLGRTAISAGSSVSDYEIALLRIRANSPFSAPGIRVSNGLDQATMPRAIEASILRAGGYSRLEKDYDGRTLEAADRHFRAGVGLQELILLCARENGFSGNTIRGNEHEALRCAFLRGSGFSTISLPGTLSNVANKFIVESFNGVEQAWAPIAKIRTANDFKQITSYSLTGDLNYQKVGPGGELKHGGLAETSYTNQAETYGRILAITRKDIINDDLGAFMAIPKRMGRGAALAINEIFWAAFLAGVGSFWTSGRTNLISGGGSALSSAALDTATSTFRNQTDPDGKPLGAMPRILLVPPVLSMTGAALMNSTLINTGGSSTLAAVPNQNVWQGMYRLVSSTYLSNASYTGYSTTAWFLLCDPEDIATIEIAFLNGRQTPIVESADAEFNTLGIQFRGYHDFGVALQEYRGSVRSAGA